MPPRGGGGNGGHIDNLVHGMRGGFKGTKKFSMPALKQRLPAVEDSRYQDIDNNLFEVYLKPNQQQTPAPQSL